MEVDVSFSVYDITVPVMVHGLNVMDNYLDHAQALERTKGFEPGSILAERLAPDMLTFGKGMGGDAPMAGVVMRADLAAKIPDTSVPNTFAANSVVCGAIRSTERPACALAKSSN